VASCRRRNEAGAPPRTTVAGEWGESVWNTTEISKSATERHRRKCRFIQDRIGPARGIPIRLPCCGDIIVWPRAYDRARRVRQNFLVRASRSQVDIHGKAPRSVQNDRIGVRDSARGVAVSVLRCGSASFVIEQLAKRDWMAVGIEELKALRITENRCLH